jgi:hypothetical protein
MASQSAARSLTLALLFTLSISVSAVGQASAPPASAGNTPTVFDQPALVSEYQSTITANELASHLYLLASDLFEGRETTTRGQKLAAHYLASQYRRMGLSPKGTAASEEDVLGAYLQPFPVFSQRLQKATLTATRAGDVLASSVFGKTEMDGKSYLAFGNMPEVSGSLVFGGYGISDKELGYDDYEAMQAAGLVYTDGWLMVLRDEPLADAETSLLPTEDGKPSTWTQQPNLKFNAMFQRGLPKGILIVGDAGPAAEKSVKQAAKEQLAQLDGVGSLSLKASESSTQYPPFFVISSELADKMLESSGKSIEDLRAQIGESVTPVVFAVPDVVVSSTLSTGGDELGTENVLALVEGSDPVLKNEVVLISSHYDHIGLASGAKDGDTVNNGADDDGSGTVALLEIAEAFMRAKEDGHGPRRSILFVNFTGEEKGLLGSAYFADVEPTVALENIVSVLNIDMIGRADPTHTGDSDQYVYIIGSNLISKELHEINVGVNDVTNIGLDLNERFNSKDDPNRFYARSDQWNFGKHNIPFIFFFTGTHEDYHQPGDEPHKILYDRMADISRLIFGTAWQVANQDERPELSGTGFN